MKKIISFLNTDIKIINSYFLFAIILIILVCVGYSSYALFSFTKTSTNIIEGTVGELSKSGTDTLIKLTDNKDNSGLYTITHAADSTLQIGTNESVTEYRYRGASPKNYVTFNNEVWRIIGIFPTDDGNGNIENRIKIVRNESIGNKYWDTNGTYGSNNWARPADLNTYLNETYYNSINNLSQNMIANSKYYLGGNKSAGSITTIQMYQYERKISGSNYFSINYPNSWVGKLALMYASDYGYASDNCETKLFYELNDDASKDIRACNQTNWLYNIKTYEWLLPHFVGDSRAFFVGNTGYIYINYIKSNQMAVRPTLYLKSNVQIMDGDGTSTNPYKLSIEIKTKKVSLTDGALTLSNLTNNKDNSGLYSIIRYKGETLQIGNDDNLLEYRYRGASSKNYVKFNNETWRIIGVFPTDDGTGNIENRVKLIKDQSIGEYKWDTSGSNNWARPATLNTELNTTYLNSLDSIAQNMIGNTKYYLGGYGNSQIQKDVMYQYEKKINGSTYYNGSNPNNWVGKLSLMYASDYGYAVSDEYTQTLYNYNNATCKNNNWLFKGNGEWILPQNASYSVSAFLVLADGSVTSSNVGYNQLAVRPVLYLKSSVKITGGDGTSSSPYTLGL